METIVEKNFDGLKSPSTPIAEVEIENQVDIPFLIFYDGMY